MPTLMSELGIDSLSAAERLRLVDELWDSLENAEPESPEITAAQSEELDRRLALVAANATKFSSWAEVEARVRARLQR